MQISPIKLLPKATTYAKPVVNISDEEIDNMMHSRKSLLFSYSDLGFDVRMRSFDGTELC